MSYFPQPTLFPRVSKTGETELWHVRPFFWKHFLEQALFQFFDMIQLTLMKGDELVELLEKGANLSLFDIVRNINSLVEQLGFSNSFYCRALNHVYFSLQSPK